MTKKLWGGRFTKEIDKDFFEFQKSIQYDHKLAKYDIQHSIIHIGALYRADILDNKEYIKLLDALCDILKEIEQKGSKSILNSENIEEIEDIHTYIQEKVENKVGSLLALKLHTLRSRNDQVVFDEKSYCERKALDIARVLIELEKSIFYLQKKYKKQPFVGYTHTQRAQAILFDDYLSAFVKMFFRDHDRVNLFVKNSIIYIGAGALTGSSLTKNNYEAAIREFLKDKDLKGIEPVENSLDNVSDRDFMIEFLSILSILQMHLSRLADDFILYSTKEFNFIELPEKFCTGSSLMPHKKNPDFLELVRGYTGRIYGNLVSILTTMKGLPLTYNRDMQLDKEPLFSSVEIIENELKIMAKFIKAIKLKKEIIAHALTDKTLYATELAEWLVINKDTKVPFKQAHDIVGKLIKLAEKKDGGIEAVSDQELAFLHRALNQKIIKKVMNAGYAISLKKTFSRSIPKRKGIKDSKLL